MKIAVRIDDITPDMDWASFYRFKSLLDQYGIRPLLGIVPDNQDDNLQIGRSHEYFWSYMQELEKEGWSLAQHGWKHLYTTAKGGLFPLNHFSEFAGISFEKQREMLKQGKQILQNNGITTTVFMAPGHSYDRNTLQALAELGFRYITDGFANQPYRDQKSGLVFLPIAFHARKDVRREKGYTTLVYHLNKTQNEQFDGYQSFFEQYKNDFIPYTELMDLVPEKGNRAIRVTEMLLANIKFLIVRLRWLLGKIRR